MENKGELNFIKDMLSTFIQNHYSLKHTKCKHSGLSQGFFYFSLGKCFGKVWFCIEFIKVQVS